MERKQVKPLKWTKNSNEHAYMKMRQGQNLKKCAHNRNENWMHEKLLSTGFKWTRQAQWGYRLFDFWCHSLGIAVEVDGPEHDKDYDSYRDEYNYRRSGIIVLRVGNGNEQAAKQALETIAKADTWKERRESLGLSRSTKKARRHWVTD